MVGVLERAFGGNDPDEYVASIEYSDTAPASDG